MARPLEGLLRLREGRANLAYARRMGEAARDSRAWRVHSIFEAIELLRRSPAVAGIQSFQRPGETPVAGD